MADREREELLELRRGAVMRGSASVEVVAAEDLLGLAVGGATAAAMIGEGGIRLVDAATFPFPLSLRPTIPSEAPTDKGRPTEASVGEDCADADLSSRSAIAVAEAEGVGLP